MRTGSEPGGAHLLRGVAEASTNVLDTPESREAVNAALDSLDFLGTLTCSHTSLVAGAYEEVLLDYEVGSSGITDSGGLKLCFKFYSDWDFQTSDPTGGDYCSVEYETGSLIGGASPQGSASLERLRWRYDHKGGERPFQKAVIIDLADGYLRPGDHVYIRLGDKRYGGPGTRVQTFVESGFCFRLLVDPLGTQRYARGPDVLLDIVAGPPAQLVLTTARVSPPGEESRVGVHLEDAWGNPLRDHGGTVRISTSGAAESRHVVEFPVGGWASADMWLSPRPPGELRIDAVEEESGLVAAPAFVDASVGETAMRCWFGDLHVHTNDTVGTNDNEYNFSYAKDVARLDFMGYTANDFQITDERWERVVDLADKFTAPGSFICFPGVEWCGTPGVGGDHNVVFIGEDTTLARCVEWHEEMGASRPVPQAWPISRLYEAYEANPEDYLLIPHVGGRRAVLDWHHPGLERLIEVHSAWGPDPWFFEDAMRRGMRVGASGASDEHRGRPGGGHPGANIFGSRGGLCGVLSESLDKGAIGTALRSRHTWATTGRRMVALMWSPSHGAIQGDCVELGPDVAPDQKIEVSYAFFGDAGWESLSAYDGSGQLWERNFDEEAGYGDHLVRLRWGGARVKDRYRWTLWEGKLTVGGTVLDSVGRWGFQHDEHLLARSPGTPNAIVWSGRTYGDAQGAVLSLRDLGRASFVIEATLDGDEENPCRWEVSGAELAGGASLRKEVGGVDLFMSLERLSEAELPRKAEGHFTVTAESGMACVYLRGRQRDGHEAWTSPIFIERG